MYHINGPIHKSIIVIIIIIPEPNFFFLTKMSSLKLIPPKKH